MQDKTSKSFPQLFRENFKALGTEISIQLVVENMDEFKKARKDILDVKKEYEKYTKIFSRFDVSSELSFLNENLGKFQESSLEMRKIAELSLEFYQKTERFFDPRILDNLEAIGYVQDFGEGIVSHLERKIDEGFFQENLENDLQLADRKIFFGKRMDFSGIAKGFITDQITLFLRERGWKSFLVDSGGDMYFSGIDEEAKKWAVDIEGISFDKLMFFLSDSAIATSGIGKRKWEIDGQRFHHIINPKSNQAFSFDLRAVTVVADSTVQADVWAKTLFLMGKKDGMMYVKEHGIKAVFLDYRGSAWISLKAKELLNNLNI